ncbi:MAG: outer membrane protein assembly factor BamE [Thermodesulfovibrionia bacterium]|nr:outer membrane protein assembly factor BamE [Thermodesulfovibrionia bacterium]
MLKYVTVIILTLIVGCSFKLSEQEKHVAEREKFPSLKMNDIEIGMTKQQVIGILGQPSSTSAINNQIDFKYRLHEWNHPSGQEKTEYFVRFINGKVESFGRSGDYDSTKVPETKTTIDLNIKNKDSK